MLKIRIAALVTVLGMVLMGASECNIGGKSNAETCEITARDTTTITLTCTDKEGNSRTDVLKGMYSDSYPNCQVGTFWPGCKGKGGHGGN